MDFINSIPHEALYGFAGLVVGYFGRLIFKDRDRMLSLAFDLARKYLLGSLEPGSEQSKAMARETVVKSIADDLRKTGVSKGAENLARLGLEKYIRERKQK